MLHRHHHGRGPPVLLVIVVASPRSAASTTAEKEALASRKRSVRTLAPLSHYVVTCSVTVRSPQAPAADGFLRHPGLAQPGVVCGLDQSPNSGRVPRFWPREAASLVRAILE